MDIKPGVIYLAEVKKGEYTYKLIFCMFTVLGAAITLGSVTLFSDSMIFAMLIPNMIGLFLLRKKVKAELTSYLKLIKKQVAIPTYNLWVISFKNRSYPQKII